MSLFEWLVKLDKIAFILIHQDADGVVLDQVLPLLRHPFTWIPLYGFIFYFIVAKHRDSSWGFILLSILTVVIADRLSAGVLKPLLQRPRPCFDPELQPFIRHVVDCGGMFSFPSSHAANHFGLASFWYGSIKGLTGKKWRWLWLWASVICYAQVYVGKHFPLDIIAGALLGCMIGITLQKAFERAPIWKRTFFPYLSPSKPMKNRADFY